MVFGRSGGNGGDERDDEPRELIIPPPRTLIVRELVTRRDGTEAWEDIAYQAHTIQTTEAGGINLLRIAMVEGIGAVQQMVVGLPSHRWNRIHEEIDLSHTSPLALH